jgi:2-C-methyl-D-erythritol 4-phosphate cytidylyltransferase
MGGAMPKQFMRVAGKPVLAHTLSALANLPLISIIFLMVAEERLADAAEVVSEWGRQRRESRGGPEISITAGGAERADSVYNGLRRLPSECDWVIIHDAVRPFATPRLIKAALEGALKTGACIAAIPSTDTVKRARDGVVLETLSRDDIWLVQTPQVFRKQIVVNAYQKAISAGWTGTDDASFIERMGVPVSIVRGEPTNIKLTTPDDFQWAEWFLSAQTGKRRP